VAVLLFTARPRSGAWLGPVGPLAVGTAGILAVVYLALSLVGNPWHMLAALAGEPLAAEPSVVSLAPGRNGDLCHFSVTLTNLTQYPIRVIGGRDDCACITTAGLPLELPPRGSAS